MHGSYATVHKETANDGTVLAIKVYLRSHGRHAMLHAHRELRALEQLKLSSYEEASEKFLIYLISSESSPLSLSLRFRFHPHTLDKITPVSQELARKYVLQLAKALDYVHSLNLVHCDLTPQNILVADDGNLRLADFGCAHPVTETIEGSTEGIGTRWYVAPEHLLSCPYYAPPSDIWSLGCIWLEMISGRPAFCGGSDLEQLGMLVRAIGRPSKEVANELSVYPDGNKLIFFAAPVEDSQIVETVEDGETQLEDDGLPPYMCLSDMIKPMSNSEQGFVKQMLSWSVKNRPKAIAIIETLSNITN
ncbi:hypothetical protein NQZ79_g465 [Umbelopsis isabellina]|nr:hypothetical protein NQZ79_g465 [Umbelopsis isabellina]